MADLTNQDDPWALHTPDSLDNSGGGGGGGNKRRNRFNIFGNFRRKDELELLAEEDPEFEEVMRKSIDMVGAARVSLAYDEFLEFCGTGKFSQSTKKERANFLKRAFNSLVGKA
eukprot:CAMPEP_0198736556 /NCGR_PEP_ID=MMETSP1475-20131203/66470_1 /TAXON_ID= ORGANISM="Unidentified sp., Strain CCMP1999" /NCGR_SAMPLE_ID=MMETSP1475 /ASSEMBLY_ACC=CAM_ASM_001111 /LENGTH=113 /DNA_ID=CAMNT_0044500383 /DNA_START=56 /DNA_END=397 /DNA_ORIENTATION=-